MSGPRRYSWKGFENEKAKLHDLTRKVKESDEALRSTMSSTEATGRILMGLRDMETVRDVCVRRAVNAQLELRHLQEDLVWNKGFDFDFIRCEWAQILDTSDAMKMQCARIMEHIKARR